MVVVVVVVGGMFVCIVQVAGCDIASGLLILFMMVNTR